MGSRSCERSTFVLECMRTDMGKEKRIHIIHLIYVRTLTVPVDTQYFL